MEDDSESTRQVLRLRRSLLAVWKGAEEYSVKWSPKPQRLRQRIKAAKNYVIALERAYSDPSLEPSQDQDVQGMRIVDEVLEAARYWAKQTTKKAQIDVNNGDSYIRVLRLFVAMRNLSWDDVF